MLYKERNAEIAKLVAQSPFWNGRIFCRYFTDDFTMDIPNAPLGMPTHYDTWEAERCFEWLNRTVKKWEAKIVEFYPTPDANLFWVQGIQKGLVHWDEDDGKLESDFFMKIEFKNGKVSYISWRFHTWSWLVAAGKRYHTHVEKLPIDENGNVDEYNKEFLINSNEPDIQAYCNNPSFGEIPHVKEEKLDDSKEAIYQRRQINIYQFASGVERDIYRHKEVLSEDYKKQAYFVGGIRPEEQIDGDNDPVLFAWNKVCSPWMTRDPRSKFYPTDNPNVYFVEMNAHGPGCWRANGVKVGHYKQNYLVRIVLDDMGRLAKFEEIANPINSLNSTGAQIDNFPYYK